MYVCIYIYIYMLYRDLGTNLKLVEWMSRFVAPETNSRTQIDIKYKFMPLVGIERLRCFSPSGGEVATRRVMLPSLGGAKPSLSRVIFGQSACRLPLSLAKILRLVRSLDGSPGRSVATRSRSRPSVCVRARFVGRIQVGGRLRAGGNWGSATVPGRLCTVC